MQEILISCVQVELVDIVLNILACQAHPALVKIGPVFMPLFNFNSPLDRIGLTDRVSLRLGRLAVFWRPHPSGTRQYITHHLQ